MMQKPSVSSNLRRTAGIILFLSLAACSKTFETKKTGKTNAERSSGDTQSIAKITGAISITTECVNFNPTVRLLKRDGQQIKSVVISVADNAAKNFEFEAPTGSYTVEAFTQLCHTTKDVELTSGGVTANISLDVSTTKNARADMTAKVNANASCTSSQIQTTVVQDGLPSLEWLAPVSWLPSFEYDVKISNWRGSTALEYRSATCTASSTMALESWAQNNISTDLISVGGDGLKARLPCQWISWGCARGAFAGEGTAIAFSSIYVDPVDSTPYDIDIKENNNTEILVRVPSKSNNKWQGTVNTSSQSSASILKNQPQYTYLAQYNAEYMQAQYGSCGPVASFKTVAENYLKYYEFNAGQIADFLDYWTPRLPASFCHYVGWAPQVDRVTTLAENGTAQGKRLWFLIVPDSYFVEKPVVKKGTMIAKLTKPKKMNMAEAKKIQSRGPAAAPGRAVVREAGISFLIHPTVSAGR